MDSDDDLLELAGADSSPEYDPQPHKSSVSRGAKRVLDESDEEDNRDVNDDEDDDDNNDEDNDDPYPFEGKFVNEEDKAKLMAMDEVAREAELYDREQQKEKYRERKFLALRAKQQKAQQSYTASSANSAKRLRASKLSELKKQRERQSARARGDYDDYEDEEDDDNRDLEELAGYAQEEEEDYYYDEDEKYGSRSSEDYQDAGLSDINDNMRSSRSILYRFLYRDEFDTAISGTFVRVHVGQNNYRMARVESVVRGGKPYTFMHKPCNTYLEVSQGKSTNKIEISILSDSPFTEIEFKKYKDRLTNDNHSLPSIRELKRKFEQLKAMSTKKLTDEDINRMMKKKEELSIYSMDSAARVRKVARLREELQVALEQGNATLVESLSKEIELLSKVVNQNQKSRLDKLNQRNQKSNQEYIRKAEQKAALRRKLMSDVNDPFSRLRTNPKLFYTSNSTTEVQVEEDKNDENTDDDWSKSVLRNKGVESLIGSIKLELNFDNL